MLIGHAPVFSAGILRIHEPAIKGIRADGPLPGLLASMAQQGNFMTLRLFACIAVLLGVAVNEPSGNFGRTGRPYVTFRNA